MKVTVQDAASCRKILHVEVPDDGVVDEYGKVINVYAESVKVPGFRKGKAPAHVVERRYAKNIAEETRDRLIPRFCKEALAQEEINPVALIGVHDVDFEDGKRLAFKVTVDVAPQFKLPKYMKIKLKATKVVVADTEVEEAYNRLLDSFARFEDVARTDVCEGDLVKVDYVGTCEDKPLREFAPNCAGIDEGKDFWVFLGDREFLPGFSQALIGSTVNQEIKVNVHFPDDYHVTEVSGRDAIYMVVPKGIREKILPELNEEFWKKLNVGSEAELREKIRQELLETAESNEKNRLKEEISKYLLENTKLDLPKSVVDHETNLVARNMVENIAMRGATKEQIEAQKDDILNMAVKSSKDRVKLSYILEQIAEKENIQVEENEVEGRIAAMAEYNKTSADRLKSELNKRNSMEKLKSDIRSEKTLDFLLEHSKIKK
ncbi:trigger factor [Verrucomicrobiota bacterium]